ncbi:hypothetical protein D3C83_43580 [compost metagenome]
MGHAAAAVEHERRAIENEFVLSAHQVGIDQRHPGFHDALAHHVIAHPLLAQVIRRGIEHQQHPGARFLCGARRLGVP